MAAVAGSGAGPPGSSQRPSLPIVTWTDTTSHEDAIAHAIQDDPELAHIADRLDSNVTLDPDRDLGLDVDGYSDAASDGQVKDDSDSVSTTSSQRDTAVDRISNASASPAPERKISPDPKDHSTNETSSDSSSPDHKPSSSETSPSSTKQANGNSTTNTTSLSPSSSHKRRGSTESSLSLRGPKSNGAIKSSSSSSSSSSCSSKKNPLQLLRRLTKSDKGSAKKKTADHQSEFSAVVVDRLPQVFVVKYLGHKEVSGVCGLHHVRRPVDEMVKVVKEKLDAGSPVQLPLLYVVVSPKGLDLREHKANTVHDVAPLGVMPIDFISYGVQDIKYWRVFTCIVVSELSSRSRTAMCHVFLCDSSHNGRKMALALGAAFNVYSKKLTSAGKTHNFQIELRPPDELADAVDAECEA